MTDWQREAIAAEIERQYPWLRGMPEADLRRHIRRMEAFMWAYVAACVAAVAGVFGAAWRIA